MTGLVDRVRGSLVLGCLVKGGLSKEGCKVRMTDAPDPRLVVDFDKPGSPAPPGATRCDYLLVAEGGHGCGWVVPLELKRGKLHADQAVRQLQQGALAAEAIIPANEPIRFRPVVVSGGTRKHERDILKVRKVRFRDSTEPARLLSCGAPLVQALRP